MEVKCFAIMGILVLEGWRGGVIYKFGVIRYTGFSDLLVMPSVLANVLYYSMNSTLELQLPQSL